jgi:glycosyltransferase involved in cell wall biosynthesis
MSGPLVSIITISFNSAEFIEKTIKSVIGQDYPDIEYIIVDGGSTDGTVDIIKKYEDRITKWVSEPDRGPTDAFNKGVKMASGDIFAFLNADDYYADGSVVRRVMEVFKQSENIKMVYGILNYVDSHTEESIMRWGKDADPSEIRRRMYIPTPTIFRRKSLWEDVGPYSEDYDYADDYEWTIRALKITRPYFLNYTITCMRDMGRSDQNYREALAETARALKENGYYLDYVRTIVRNFIKTVLIELGLRDIVYRVWARKVSPKDF